MRAAEIRHIRNEPRVTFKLVECRPDDFAVFPGDIKRYIKAKKAYSRMPFLNNPL